MNVTTSTAPPVPSTLPKSADPARPVMPEPASWRARISYRRPIEAILFEQSTDAGHTVVTVLVDRRSGELSFVGEVKGLAPSEVEELRGHARGGTEGLQPIELPRARLRVARAILATRIAGRLVPNWLASRADLVGDPCHPASRIDDIYLCDTCDQALPPDEQLAHAHRNRDDHTTPSPRCPACRGEPAAPSSDPWLARAWLMLAADLPHRALVNAARAEAERTRHLPTVRLSIVRGLAHLRLEQGPQALAFFQQAVEGERREGRGVDKRLAVWVSRAEDLSDRLSRARTNDQRDLTVPTPAPGHTSTRSFAAIPAFAF